MNCQVLSTLYVKSNGEILCECDAGENVSLGFVEAGGDWSIGKIFNNEKYARIRSAFSQNSLPWEPYCLGCAFLRTKEPLCDRITEKHLTKVQVEISLHCTLACLCCSRRRQIRERPKPHVMDPRLFEQLLRSSLDEGYTIDFIEYCGQGEPLSHPNFKEFASIARDLFPQTKQRLVTNGNYDYRSAIGDAFIDEIYVSCDGVYQQSYEQYRKNGSVDKAIRFMIDAKARKEKRPLVVWKYILFEFNDTDEEVIAAQRRAMEIGVDSIAFIRTHTEYNSRRFEMEGIQGIPVITPIAVVDSTPIHDGIHVVGKPIGNRDSRLEPILHETICVFDEVKLLGTNYITLRGWAMGKNGKAIKTMWILCDHEEIGMATCGLPRPDVAQHYPFEGALYSGFFLSMKLAKSIRSVASLTARMSIENSATEDFEVVYRFDQPQSYRMDSSIEGRPFGSIDPIFIRKVGSITCVIDTVRLVGDDFLSIQGWASDKHNKQLRDIFITVDQKPAGKATLGLSREDLVRRYPNMKSTHLGFSFLETIPGIETHILTISLSLTTQKKKTQEFEVIYRFDKR